ncbi:tRNA dihydrouridine(20/20a) synthase DusA [Methylomarinum sp. Ch1-1]|uniref:tRNA-dihydrouridine(20/20a) synthase n=1 Tax=Methylomarinum roseum TaxID=3067653 RepID=A0AAU7NS07_9GAMM|nr:tRNA dihydrouridine(20/20a) synthase DusA [Methylomarinum sp. Ch1-1]MDP4520241.1 tRNA dihydrouridine(20/20a) synthase DusA [Methylomarinum sp. Ch1-1]
MSEAKPVASSSCQDSAHRFCVAPMLDWTDRHCRYFYRLMSKHALLYSEMVTTGAIIHGDRQRFLQFNHQEHPVAFQLGGSNPADLATCARIVEDYGYDEINLNVGCPSDRVQNGMFGACLMAQPELVAECVAAMQRGVAIPVTVKSRIGIDDRDSYQQLTHFIAVIAATGCRSFIVHARKAWLQGLSPKQNREVPPLRYDLVYRLKQDFPQLEIVLNGGITTLEQVDEHLRLIDGVMVGREIYHNPYLLAQVDGALFFDEQAVKSRQQVVLALIPYIQQQLAEGVRLNSISRHILGLFHGVAGAKGWRRHISENAHKPDADENVILQALKFTQ